MLMRKENSYSILKVSEFRQKMVNFLPINYETRLSLEYCMNLMLKKDINYVNWKNL